jgi:hypothetical protein
MDAILALPDTSKPRLRAFNRCQIFFGVGHLSEIATADGTSICRDHAWNGSRHRISSLLWPYQPCPGPKSVRVWRRLLATAFLKRQRPRVSNQTIDLTLQTPVRRWLPTSFAFRYHWESFYSPSLNSLLLLSDDATTFMQHPSLKTRHRPRHPVRAFSTACSDNGMPTPPDAAPVDYSVEPNKYTIPVTIATLTPFLPVAAPTVTWPHYITNIPTWKQTLLEDICRRNNVYATRLFEDSAPTPSSSQSFLDGL